MDDDLLQEFDRYLAHLGGGLGHADRQAGLRGYCAGLMAPLKRKSVEPMAAHQAPQATRVRHQCLHHFVAESAWSDEEMLLRVAQWVAPKMDFSEGGWWIVDGTGFPKQGRHSVGVARQYCGMLGKQGLPYVVGVAGQVTVWPPGQAPRSPAPCSGKGVRPARQRLGHAVHERPQSVKELAYALEPSNWQSIEWREGGNFTLRSRFARVRVRAAHRERLRTEQRAQEWLLIEWPEGHKEPMKYWLCTLGENITLERMVYEAKMRWRIERDSQDLKQDLGLGHFEGRGWRGFHHHASLCIAA